MAFACSNSKAERHDADTASKNTDKYTCLELDLCTYKKYSKA